MRAGSHFRLLAVVAVLVLAGCTFGVGDTQPVAPIAGADDSEGFTSLENHSLDVDPDRTFDRTATIVGEDVQRPPVNVLQPADVAGVGNVSTEPPSMAAAFVDHHGIDERNESTGTPAGLTTEFGNVYLVEGSGPPPVMEQVLVHEYVHAIQFRTEMLRWETPRHGAATTDAYLTRMALIEGGPVYVADIYTRTHSENVPLQSDHMMQSYEASPTGDRFLFAPYAFGSSYFEAQLDDPASFRTVYEKPPPTTAHVLHNYSSDRELTRPLPADAEAAAGWVPENRTGSDVVGELGTRIVLSAVHDDGRAADAATGWRNDTVLVFEHNDTGDGIVWLVRFDDAANATTFHRAAETYADQRADTSHVAYRAERPDDELVAIYSGPESFVDSATVSGSVESVRVTVGTETLGATELSVTGDRAQRTAAA